MVYINSSITGSGKTSASITFMLENPDRRYLFITPYLTEVDRIMRACHTLDFQEPKDRSIEGQGSKLRAFNALVESGKNIVTTHELFKRITPETFSIIGDLGYTLIMDESLDIMEKADISRFDIEVLKKGGAIKSDGEHLIKAIDEYPGGILDPLFNPIATRNLLELKDINGLGEYRWFVPVEAFLPFKDIYILTYLFDGQLIKYYFDINHIEYQKIGVTKDAGGVFRLAYSDFYIPKYVYGIYKLINVVSNDKMNAVGDNKFALSLNWYKRTDQNPERVKEVKNNLYNFFVNMNRELPPDRKLCGCYADYKSKIKGKGYTKGIVAFNARATNDYAGRDCVAYPVNVFMNQFDATFFRNHGAEIDQDAYSLSVMIQFIWRSAIRTGRPIDLYLPSSRMRSLLFSWMKEVSKGRAINV